MIGSEEDETSVETSNESHSRNSMSPAQSSFGDESSIKLRQIEFNTMAASFAGLSQNLTSYHRSVQFLVTSFFCKEFRSPTVCFESFLVGF